jgi:3-dehydroquinate dehydratase
MAVVVSCLADSLAELASVAQRSVSCADVIELRLDRLSVLDERELATLIG